MENIPHQSLRKRMFHRISRLTKKRGKSHERTSGEVHDSRVDHPERPSSAPLDIPYQSSQEAETSVSTSSAPSLAGLHSSTVDTLPVTPHDGRAALVTKTSASSATSVTHAPIENLVKVDDASQPPSSKSMQTAKNVGKAILGLLSSAAEGIPVPGVKGIFDTMIKVVGAIETTQANQDTLKDLESRLRTLIDTVIIPMKGNKISEIPDISEGLADLERGLAKLMTDVENKLKSSKISNVINHADDMAVIKDMDSKITQFLDVYSVRLMTHGVVSNYEFHQGNREMQAIEKLPWVKAAYDHLSHGQDRTLCFAGTRDQLLTEIKDWIHDLGVTTPIYVLYGIAGIGKTTVAQTVAQYAADKKLLGASFFFSRAEDERKSGYYFFATLAFQLALHDMRIGAQIAAALVAEPDLPQKSFEIQLKHLLLDPILKAQGQTSIQPMIIVVDAMDECLPVHAKTILQLLAKNIKSVSGVKVFITTRPESHIQTIQSAQGLLQPFYLHEIERSVVMGDIQLFLEHALSKEQIIAALEYSQWEPTKDELKALTEKCGILFIMATTAVRYILDEANKPASQMDRLLNGLDIKEEEDGVMSSLDRMYSEILKSSVPKRYSKEYLQDFQRVVGIIIVLEDLLPLAALARFLGMKESDVQITLRNLHSIMAPTSNHQAPQVYHKSFPDFITNQERCTDIRFYISPSKNHAKAAQYCFKTMNKVLHANMYNLQGIRKYMSNAEIVKNASLNTIPDELKYACIHWATHLNQARDEELEELLKLFHEFTLTHLLHWIEVLSYIEKLDIAHPAMKLAQQVLAIWNEPKALELNQLLNDGSRCVTKFYEIIKGSAQHIYYSALPFMPIESQIYKRFGAALAESVAVVVGQDRHWNHLLATLQGHSNTINSIDFSLDGSRLASGSDDGTVKLWDGLTGACIATVEGHSDAVTTVVFSPDGSRLASGSDDSTIKLWDWLTVSDGFTVAQIATLKHHLGAISTIAFSPGGSHLASGSWDSGGHVNVWDLSTGAYIGTSQDHSDAVTTVVFSPDGSRLASGSYDHSVILWDWFAKIHIKTLEGHSETVTTLAFSPNGSTLASGSEESIVMLWNGLTGDHIANLEGHSDAVSTIEFSPDGSKLASGSEDGTVMLWNGSTGAHISTLEAHSGAVNTVTFSPDGSMLASASEDTTISIWDSSAKILIATLEGHSQPVYSVTFSPDGTRLASGSKDRTVKIWDGFIGAQMETRNCHSNAVYIVALSPDRTRLASGSWDSTVRLWNRLTGALIATLEGHSGVVCAVAFSSNGSRMASGSYGGTVKLWDGLTGTQIADLEGHTNAVHIVEFSPDGSRLASGSRDRRVKLWDGLTGLHIATLEGHSNPIHGVEFSLNGSRLTSYSDDGVFLWDAITGTCIQANESRLENDLESFTNISSSEVPTPVENPHIQIDVDSTPNDSHTSTPLPDHYRVSSGAIIHIASNVPVMWLPGEYHQPTSVVQSQGTLIAMGFITGQVVLLDLSSLASHL